MTLKPDPASSTVPTLHGGAPRPLDLAERMALRCNLAERAVQIGLALVGVSRSSYRARTVPIDARHHRFLVALDVSPEFRPVHTGRELGRDGLEAWLQDVARQRYRVIFDAVYWRGNGAPPLGLRDELSSLTGAGRVSADTAPAWDVQVSDEERQALLDAVQRGMALPPLIVDDDVYQTGPAPLESRVRKT